MKIFVTGGTGFIGTFFMRTLQKTNHEAVCLVREHSDVRQLQEAGVQMVIGDVTRKSTLIDAMKGCDWVVNLANLFEFWIPDCHKYREVNVEGTRNVMEAALENAVSKVVHVSTLAVYGNTNWPATEENDLGSECYSIYAQTKREGELLVWDFYREKKLPVVMIYPGGVIGPDDPKPAGRYLKKLLEGKLPAQILTKSMFPWVYVGDVAKAILLALEKEGNIGEKYFLAAENKTFGDINKLISEVSGKPIPKLVMPDSMATLGSYVFTGIANLIHKPPLMDMSTDQISLMKHGLEADGSKASGELGLTYKPVRKVLEEVVREAAVHA
jgi:dihydroflavonol-4-reductase